MGRFPGPLVDGLDIVFVREVLARTDFNVTASARELGVPASALRRLFLSDRQLQDEALEAAEARCDLAEQNHMEALRSEDPERRDKASRFELRNSVRARLRGWFNGVLASAEITEPKHFTISWRNADGSLAPQRATETVLRDGREIEQPLYDRRADEPFRLDGPGEVAPNTIAPDVAIVDEPDTADDVHDLRPLIGVDRDRVEAALRQRPGDRYVILSTVEANGFDISGL